MDPIEPKATNPNAAPSPNEVDSTSPGPKLGVWGLVLLAALAALAAWQLPIVRWGIEGIEYLRGQGTAGVGLYAAVYVVATVLMLPGAVLTIGAGAIYGLGAGFVIVWPASVVGAILAFLCGRRFARSWVEEVVRARPRLSAIDTVIGNRGFAMVCLLRLSPLVPFAISNYVYGVTGVRFRDYAAATTLGMVPGIILYVYIGTTVTNTAALAAGQRPDAGLAGQLMFYGGLVATVAITVWASRLASAEIRRRLEDAAPQTRR